MNQEEQVNKMGQIIAKAWTDDVFKQRLLKDAAAVLKEEGMDLPQGLEVRMVENTDKVFHMVLPPKPEGDELSDDQLSKAAGGSATSVSDDSQLANIDLQNQLQKTQATLNLIYNLSKMSNATGTAIAKNIGS